MYVHAASRFQGPRSRKRQGWSRPRRGPSVPDSKPPMVDKTESAADAPIRAGLVARIRREIAAGTYDTEEKWEIALDRLFDELER